MTELATAPAESTTGIATGPIPDSSLRRFHPATGVFLQADHLDQINKYAESFALVAGAAAGSGVDHGLNVTVNDTALRISSGLAVDASRRPLRLATNANAEIRLDKLDPHSAHMWVVEIEAADPVPAGREPDFSSLGDAASGSGALKPWLDAAVRIRVRPLDLNAKSDSPTRNELASAYFTDERTRGQPWLPPLDKCGLLKRAWHEGSPADPPVSGAVPIAALLRDDGNWVVDTWIARRDIGGPPARAAWEGHLGLRSWNVFTAQVLQFQAHLAVVVEGASTSKSGAGGAFVELPSAGILPLPPSGWRDPASYFSGFFGTRVPVEVERLRADCALRALEGAQHLERIRLDTPGADTYVRLLVPRPERGAENWMVFLRGCYPSDCVDVRVWVQDSKESENESEIAGERVTTLQYPAGAWALPDSEGATKQIRKRIDEGHILGVSGYAKSEDRRSLAFVRSALIAFDLVGSDKPVVLPSVRTAKGKPETIVIRIEP